MLSKELLDILCCPQCHGNLDYMPDRHQLICNACGQKYSIVDDIPVMLIDNKPVQTSDDRRSAR